MTDFSVMSSASFSKQFGLAGESAQARRRSSPKHWIHSVLVNDFRFGHSNSVSVKICTCPHSAEDPVCRQSGSLL